MCIRDRHQRVPVSLDTLILDLGGVLIDVDYRATSRHFESIGITGFDALYTKAKQSDLFDRFETGELAPSGFRDEVRALSLIHISEPTRPY